MAFGGADNSNHDFPIVYAYSNFNVGQTFLRKFLVQFLELLNHLESASHCIHAGLSVATRCTKQHHHAVAHKLVHGAVVAVHAFDHTIEITC